MRFALALLISSAAFAQSNPLYIPFSPSATKGALYRPDSGPAPKVGILIAHRTSNFLPHIGARELSRRGFLVLAMNPRSDNNETEVFWDDNALDIKSGVEFLRKQPGIKTVLLFAHSGGGPTMSFYQAVAESGVSYCQGANKLWPCGDNLSGLPKADGIVFVDAHPGNSVNALRSLNGAVVDEGDPRKLQPALDPFRPENGFRKDGPSTYPAEFQRRYFKAQADRMNRLIEDSLRRLDRIKRGLGPYTDDDAIVIPRSRGARLMELDPSIHRQTLKPQKLLRNDGSVSTQICESVRVPSPNGPVDDLSFREAARILTLRSFLSTNAIRAKDSLDDIDWCSTNNSTPCALKKISVPVLFTVSGAHYFVRDNEIHLEVAASKDKDYVVVEGATHGMTPCKPCEKTPGQYSNATKNWADYIQRWIHARF